MRARPARLVVGFALLAPVLAGCIGGGPVAPAGIGGALPPQAFAGAVLETLHFTASDGGTIHGTAYVPEGLPSGSKVGTIVQMSPYFENSYRRGTHELVRDDLDFDQTRMGLYVSHGFVFVAASVPGTGLSGGCYQIGGIVEQKRMTEFIEWLATRPWSNGNVGMIGVSYDGTTPWEVAIHDPPALKTIVPIAGISDMYRYEYQDGAPYAWWGPYFLPYYLLLVGWGIDVDDGLVKPQPGLVAEDACPQAAEHFTNPTKTYLTGRYDAFWEERNYTAKMGEITASVLLVHGLEDWNVKPDHADVWAKLPSEKRMWLGQWAHTTPDRNRGHPEWSRADWNQTTLAWFDHYLHGVENGVPDALPPVQFQDTNGLWRTAEAWPAATADRVLHLHQGALTTEAGGAGAPSTFTTLPTYTPYTETLPRRTIGVPEPTVGRLHPDANPLTFAKFVSEPLTEDVRLAGSPRLWIHASVDRPGHAFLVAQLYNVSADGTWWWVNEAGRGFAQRDGRDRDDAVVPHETYTLGLEFHPSATVFHEGERIGLLVAGADAGWFHFNGNAPRVTLPHDAAHASRLLLPVLPADAPPGVETSSVVAGSAFPPAPP